MNIQSSMFFSLYYLGYRQCFFYYVRTIDEKNEGFKVGFPHVYLSSANQLVDARSQALVFLSNFLREKVKET